MPYITHQERARLYYRARVVDQVVDILWPLAGDPRSSDDRRLEAAPTLDAIERATQPFREERDRTRARYASQVHADQSTFDKVPR